MKHNSRIVIIITALLALILVGCGKKAPTHATSNQEFLSGVYKETDQDTPKDDEGRAQPNYFYFKKNGDVLVAQAETGGENNGNYGDAKRGTWKALGNNKFKISIKTIYDKDAYTFTMKKSGNQLSTSGTAKGATYEWGKDSYKKTDMTAADFMSMFNAAKESQQEKVKKNGYTDPDNNSDSASSSNTNATSNSGTASDDVDAQERAAAFKNGGRWITDKSDPAYYSDANAYVTYLQIKDSVQKGLMNPDGTETPKGQAEDN